MTLWEALVSAVMVKRPPPPYPPAKPTPTGTAGRTIDAAPRRNLWLRFLAYWRLDLDAVCKMSVGRSESDDYHDYPDDAHGEPVHMARLTCKRCGKTFII